MHQAHLAVEESIFEGIAAAYAAVLPADRARGVAVIDIGAQSTHLAVYDGDALLLATAIPVGADHLTRDLSLAAEGELRRCRKSEAGIWLRGDESGVGSQLDRDSVGRRARHPGSAAPPVERNSGSAGGRDLSSACMPRFCASGWSNRC